MSTKGTPMTPELHDYLVAHGTPPDLVLLDLIAETAALGGSARMQIAPEQGAFMTLLTRAVGAQRAIEIGTFTGYSAICIARGLADGGSLLCCDVSEEWTSIARRYWERAGLADRIELRLGSALETLRSLPVEEAFDLAFVDADKTGYAGYLDELLPRMRPGGLVLVDNVLWSGRVIDPTDDEPDTVALRAFNSRLREDSRVDVVMLPVADGLTIARKR